nr:S9 family peptidase [Rhabdobacter roseus]
MLSRPEVDGTRIGVTGRSGGGTQTAYIAALDDRVLAAAPECYITSFDKLLQSAGPQDAEQNLMHFLAKGLDLADLIEVRAPKPTLIVSTTRDMFSIQGVRDTYQEAQKAFQALGKTEQLAKVEDDAAHASTPKNREATYAFFQKYLNNPGSSEDQTVTIFSEEDLFVTPGGDVQKDRKGESLFSMNKKYAADMVQKRAQQSTDPKNIRAKAISYSGYKHPTASPSVLFSGKTQMETYTIEKYLLKGPGDYHLPVLWLKPVNTSGKAILLLDDRGKALALKQGELAHQLVSAGHEVIVPDLSGTGELGHGYMQGGDSVIEGIPLNLWYAGILTHKSLVAVRAEEISMLASFIKKSFTAPRPLAVVAAGTFTSDLLHAATFDNPFDGIVLLRPLASYQSITEERLYKAKFAMSAVAGAMQAYDLPDLVAGFRQSKLLLVNPVDATDQELGQEVSGSIFKSTLSKQSGQRSFLRTSVKPEEYGPTIGDWLK